MKREVRLFMLAALTATLVSLSAAPALAAGQGEGATLEEFVCFRSTPEKIQLGTGKVVTTPSGNENIVCTGKPF
jgi:hypothetical protein